MRCKADATRHREEYQRLIAIAREYHRPEPPPFPIGPELEAQPETG
jgi:hypothetical protein